jgi:L-fucose mutarotase
MIFSHMLHPDILSALGRAGHGSCVLIADGNYPISTHSPASATKVFLNLRRGLVKVTDVLEVLRDTIPIEQVALMATRDGKPAAIHQEFFKRLPAGIANQTLSRAEFYVTANQPETALVIATGEEQCFANILITIGVVKTEAQ